jgi:hypothetical protein
MRSKWIVWAKAQKTVSSASAMAVLMELADHANTAGECFPSIARIACSTRLGERTVRRQIAALEGLGLLRRQIGGGWIAKGKGRPNRFFLIASASDQPAAGDTSEGKATRPQWPRGDEATRPSWPRSEIDRTENIEQIGKLPGHGGRGSEVSKKVGGGSAHACEHTHASEPARGPTPSAQRQAEDAENGKHPPPAHQIDPERLGDVLEALGWARLGKRPTRDDLGRMRAWTHQLGLSHADQLEVIREVLATNRDPDAIRTFNYFSEAMQRRVGELERPPLKAIYPTENQGERANGTADKHRRFQRIIDAASEGPSGKDWG